MLGFGFHTQTPTTKGTPLNEEEKSAINDFLKHSSHIADVLNTHRQATAEVLAAFIGALIDSGKIEPATLGGALKKLESCTDRPSIDGERRTLVSRMRDRIQRQ